MAERVRVGLAGDDHAHRILAQRLADLATSHVPNLDERRVFVGDGAGRAFLSTVTADHPAPGGRPRYKRALYQGKPLGYAQVFLDRARALGPVADVALVLVDEDGDGGRTASLAIAYDVLAGGHAAAAAIFGVCNPCAEGWFVGLIGPSRPQRLKRLDSELGIKAASQPEKLTQKPTTAPKHAKRALHFLLDDEHDDVMRYSAETPKAKFTEPALAEAMVTRAMVQALDGCGMAAFLDRLVTVYAARVAP